MVVKLYSFTSSRKSSPLCSFPPLAESFAFPEAFTLSHKAGFVGALFLAFPSSGYAFLYIVGRAALGTPS
ncbi:MAG: hypothetical protein IJN97_02835, partial [Oscillospiraceae bacterium]|nr:hypothetical protein [Oscillospiraceae bacterium]